MEYKKRKAKKDHICTKCNRKIKSGEDYYCEEKFLRSLHKKLSKLCVNCYRKYGDN